MKLTGVRLLIHGFELPSFATPELRRNVRTALRSALNKVLDDANTIVIDFDEERPRITGNAIDMEVRVAGRGDEAEQIRFADLMRAQISNTTYLVIQKYVEADAMNRHVQRAQGYLVRL